MYLNTFTKQENTSFLWKAYFINNHFLFQYSFHKMNITFFFYQNMKSMESDFGILYI